MKLDDAIIIKYEYSIKGGDGDELFFRDCGPIDFANMVLIQSLAQPIPIFRVLGSGKYSGKLIFAQPRAPRMMENLIRFGSVNAVFHLYSQTSKIQTQFRYPGSALGYGVLAAEPKGS